jgi:hypothetical protein
MISLQMSNLGNCEPEEIPEPGGELIGKDAGWREQDSHRYGTVTMQAGSSVSAAVDGCTAAISTCKHILMLVVWTPIAEPA